MPKEILDSEDDGDGMLDDRLHQDCGAEGPEAANSIYMIPSTFPDPSSIRPQPTQPQNPTVTVALPELLLICEPK
jgi:hypothetical protein